MRCVAVAVLIVVVVRVAVVVYVVVEALRSRWSDSCIFVVAVVSCLGKSFGCFTGFHHDSASEAIAIGIEVVVSCSVGVHAVVPGVLGLGVDLFVVIVAIFATGCSLLLRGLQGQQPQSGRKEEKEG